MEPSASGLDSFVTFRNSQGLVGRGTLIHVTRNAVIFEVYNPYSIVQLSEVLQDMRILRGQRAIYTGRGVVSNIVATGVMLIVSATLVDPWSDLAELASGEGLREEVFRFIQDWESGYALRPSYQVCITTISSFLGELNRWLGQVETTSPASTLSPEFQREFTQEIEAGLDEKLGALFITLEKEASQIGPEESIPHKAFARRQLHPLMLVSPFIHRTFTKPLGYAGDYEMVNMIMRDRWEGQNTYAKILNSLILKSDGAQAHRNRIDRLLHYLRTEATRVSASGARKLRVLNIGCGPAAEIQRFVREDPLSERCEFHLMDFNAETLAYAKARINEVAAENARTISVTYHHKSINDLLKEAARGALGRSAQAFVSADLVYCAGLFDYLSDKICKRLLQLFYTWTNPGGLVVATNVHPRNGVRYFLEHLLEWHLIYRDDRQMMELVSDPWEKKVEQEETGVNVFLEIRKGTNAPAATPAVPTSLKTDNQ